MFLIPSLILNEENRKPVILRKSGIFGQAIHIIPRSQCSFRRVQLINKGRNATKAALLRLKKEALSTDSQFKIVPDKKGRRAGAWEFQKAPHHKPSHRYLPESLARNALDNGARIVECLEGYEGQIWRDGHLISSRWWLEFPQEKEWFGFLRASKVEVDIDSATVPNSEQIAFRSDIPIWEFSQDRAREVLSPKNLAITGLTVFGCLAVYSGTQLFHHWSEINVNSQKIDRVTDETEQIISQRNRALTNVKYVQKFDNLGHKGAVIIALGQITEVIKRKNVLLSWVRYNDGDIEIGLATDSDGNEAQIDIPTLVSDLEAKTTLSNVSMSVRSQKLLVINAQVILSSNGREGSISGQ